MSQSRKMSMAESLLNVAIGYGIAIMTQIIVFPWFGIHIYAAENAEIGAVFTVVSLVRSYTLRRFFNWWHGKQSMREFRKIFPAGKKYGYTVVGIDIPPDFKIYARDGGGSE